MRHLDRMFAIDKSRLEWITCMPLYTKLHWTAEIFDVRPDELIPCRSLPSGQVETAGSMDSQSPCEGRGAALRSSPEVPSFPRLDPPRECAQIAPAHTGPQSLERHPCRVRSPAQQGADQTRAFKVLEPDFQDREDWNRKNGTGDSPHPSPKRQKQKHHHRVQFH